MARPPFFPDPIFGWILVGILAALTAIAAVVDFRRTVVPKWLTISCLGLGVISTIIRAAWLAADPGVSAFVLEPGSPWVGAVDGLLFAISGFGVGFALFFVLWVFGACGGGDLKLFAALGAWLGPLYTVYVFAVSLVVVVGFLFVKLLRGGLAPSEITKSLKRRPKMESPGGLVRKKDRIRLTFSLPLAVSTLLVLLWVCRFDLGLATPPPSAAEKERASELQIYTA